MNRTELICRIKKFLSHKNTCVIAIDGMSASGKTTLGHELHNLFPNSCLFHMDDYFLQPHQRTPERSFEIGGNVDYDRFRSEIINNLQNPNGFTYHIYDCKTQRLGDSLHCPMKPLVIVEGAYSTHPYFGDVYDLRLFCEISDLEQKDRIIKRNGIEMWKRFKSEWIPKEHDYFRKFLIKEKSELLE